MTRTLDTDAFFRRYPDDAACLADLARRRFGGHPRCPRCGRNGRFVAVTGRRALACACGYQLNPTAGTALARTRIPLQLWFYAVWWTAQAGGVPPVRALAARLGITHPAACRLGRALRRVCPAPAPVTAARRAAFEQALDELLEQIEADAGGMRGDEAVEPAAPPRRRQRRRRSVAGEVGHDGIS